MNRRAFVRGLVAAPAIVAASSLMPIRGIIMAVPKPDDIVFKFASGNINSGSVTISLNGGPAKPLILPENYDGGLIILDWHGDNYLVVHE